MIKIICDSAADIPKEYAEPLDITVLPLSYTFDGNQYFRDGVDFTNREFYERLLKSDELPKTTQISADTLKDEFSKALQHYDELCAVFISSAGSGTYDNAVRAKAMLGNDSRIHIVDSFSYSYLYGHAICKAAEAAQNGATASQIVELIQQGIADTKVFFLVNNLEYLKRGGRINAATFVIASLLDIVPVLTINNGLVEMCGKLRGRKKQLAKLCGLYKPDILEDRLVSVMHAHMHEEAKELASMVPTLFNPRKLDIIELGATIGCHTGPGLIGLTIHGNR